MTAETHDDVSLRDIGRYGMEILRPEGGFFGLALVYGVGISLLFLATPISVQMLINTVANTGLATPLVVLAGALFGLLIAAGLMNALRVHLMEIFGRRIYARLVSEISLRAIYAQNPFFIDDGKAPLFNRYFDIIIIQKTVPVLLIGGFTLILQAAVGFVVVSLYHPLFLVFNVVVIALIWVIWLIWGGAAIKSAAVLSARKHDTASWLQGLGASNGFFKSDRHINHALDRTDQMTRRYVEQHKVHFRRHFSQTVSFILLYASASAALLGLGGWLVIQGELSLGQLVAAELILSAVFFGLSQLGTYLNYFYDLCAAIDELSLFYRIDQEEPAGHYKPSTERAELVFENVRTAARGGEAIFNFSVPGGARLIARPESHGLQRAMTNLLKRHNDPEGGMVTLGGADIRAMEVHALRQDVIVLDRPSIIETSVRDYLRLACEDATPAAVVSAVKTVRLDTVIGELEDGLDTQLSATGWPLSIAETMQLKLAMAILARPRVLIMNQLFDMLDEEIIAAALDALPREETVIYFSNRSVGPGFDGDLKLVRNAQDVVTVDGVTHLKPAEHPKLAATGIAAGGKE